MFVGVVGCTEVCARGQQGVSAALPFKHMLAEAVHALAS